jgi:hypothetical protein
MNRRRVLLLGLGIFCGDHAMVESRDREPRQYSAGKNRRGVLAEGVFRPVDTHREATGLSDRTR